VSDGLVITYLRTAYRNQSRVIRRRERREIEQTGRVVPDKLSTSRLSFLRFYSPGQATHWGGGDDDRFEFW
jgi:hypothetical protein